MRLRIIIAVDSVTGPTGSGKTTTLAAMFDRINGSRPATIVTIEDPIEVMYTDRNASSSSGKSGWTRKIFIPPEVCARP